MENLTPKRLIEAIVRRSSQSPAPVMAFWYRVEEDRDTYRSRLLEEAENLPLVPVVLRGAGFENPNAMMTDFVALLETCRNEILARTAAGSDHGIPVIVVLLSRTWLSVPQVSSPVALPGWFPRGGGTVTNVIVDDLTAKGECALNDTEVSIPELCALLHELEGALLKRMRVVAALDSRKGDALWHILRSVIRRERGYAQFLSDAAKSWGEIGNPRGYRPSAKESGNPPSLLGALIRMISSSSMDELARCSKGLAIALDVSWLPALPGRESLLSVLAVSAHPLKQTAVRTARDMLVTAYATSRLITAAAHADAYPVYPVPLVRAVSLDLRRGLRDSTELLRGLGTASN